MTDSAIPIRPPNNLRLLREASGEKPEELALALGLSKEQVSRWERGTVDIPTKYLRPLARRYGVKVDFLLALDEERAA